MHVLQRHKAPVRFGVHFAGLRKKLPLIEAHAPKALSMGFIRVAMCAKLLGGARVSRSFRVTKLQIMDYNQAQSNKPDLKVGFGRTGPQQLLTWQSDRTRDLIL